MSADDFVFFTLIAKHPDPATASRALQLAEAAVLRRAADAISGLPQDYECDPGRGDAVERLRRTAEGIEEKASATAPTATPELLPKAHVVTWLTKKAREQRARGPHFVREADAISVLASKVDRGAIRPDNLLMLPEPDASDPLVIRWDRTVIHPEADPTDDTIVCCLDAKGRPVALFLDDEHREALGLLLVDPTGEGEPQLTGRLAQLLDAIRTQGGEWTTRRSLAIYRALGDRAPLRMTVHKDLHALHAMGHLVMHEDKGRRFYTLTTRKDDRS